MSVVKSAVQCAASIYPLVFRYTLSQREDSQSWSSMMAIKSSILRRLDSAVAGVRICCIKFVARVLQVQTHGVISDPRRQDQNEISLALVPRDHPVLTPSNLEAEASGLLDRLLGILQENSQDALVVTATLNSLSTIVQKRASISTKILGVICNFNPLTLANKPMNGRNRVAIKSMTRTTVSFLLNVLKRNPNHPFAGRLQQQAEKLKNTLVEVCSDQNQLKRSAPDEPIDGLDDAKRQRLDADADEGMTMFQRPSLGNFKLGPGPVTYAQLYTLSNDEGAIGFHAETLPLNIVAQLVHALVAGIDSPKLTQALNAVSLRYLELEQKAVSQRSNAVNNADDDEDDMYSPEEFGDDGQQRRQSQSEATSVNLGPFQLPPSPPLTEEQRDDYSSQALERVFDTLGRFDKDGKKNKRLAGESGFNRISSAGQDRNGWITLLTRLATRPVFDLDDPETIKEEPSDNMALTKKIPPTSFPAKLREAFHKYVSDDYRHRIDIAITWLNEEWYTDTLLARQHPSSTHLAALPNYTASLSGLLNNMALFIDKQDLKILIRFLSEIPALPEKVYSWLLRLADDPERVQIVLGALQYLVLFRPPARPKALDCAVTLWKENPDAKKAGEKLLRAWRPAVLDDAADEVKPKTEEQSLS